MGFIFRTFLLEKIRDARRFLYEKAGNPKYSKPSLYGLDEKLAKYLNFRNGFFIEAGANDGFRQSNTYFLEKFLGWHGVLVEGIPELYKKCLKRRPNSYVYNYALVDDEYQNSTVEMKFLSLMSFVENALKTEEARQKQIEEGKALQALQASYSIQVPAITLEKLIDSLPNTQNIDFLSLDVEGYELQVLKGLNLRKYRPRYILVEARFFDEIDHFLSPYYSLAEKMTYHDFLYKARE